MTAPSEHFWDFIYAKSLYDKGHNITMLSPHSTDFQEKTFHHIVFEGTNILVLLNKSLFIQIYIRCFRQNCRKISTN